MVLDFLLPGDKPSPSQLAPTGWSPPPWWSSVSWSSWSRRPSHCLPALSHCLCSHVSFLRTRGAFAVPFCIGFLEADNKKPSFGCMWVSALPVASSGNSRWRRAGLGCHSPSCHSGFTGVRDRSQPTLCIQPLCAEQGSVEDQEARNLHSNPICPHMSPSRDPPRTDSLGTPLPSSDHEPQT